MDPKPLNRQQLAKICNGDPEAIRLLERLFQVSGQVIPDELASVVSEVNALETRVDAVEIVAADALALAEYLETIIGGSGNSGAGVLDFGGLPGGNVSSLTITGQVDIVAGSNIRAWIQGQTADFNAYEHLLILPQRIGLGIGDIVPGVGFTIHAQTELRLTGDVAVKWEWR